MSMDKRVFGSRAPWTLLLCSPATHQLLPSGQPSAGSFFLARQFESWQQVLKSLLPAPGGVGVGCEILLGNQGSNSQPWLCTTVTWGLLWVYLNSGLAFGICCFSKSRTGALRWVRSALTNLTWKYCHTHFVFPVSA